MTTRRLPSLNALRAFESAARHLSFSRAGDELHVTPAAVGQQVRALEDHLGVPLFVRMNRALELTEAGQVLLPGVRDAFEQLGTTMEWFYRRTARRPLTVSVEPDFGARWLLRRLERFRERHPGIDIRLDATTRVVDFSREPVDLAIRYGAGDYAGLRSVCLFEENIVPVCAPALLEGAHPLRTPDDLRHHTLLQTDWSPRFPTWPDWAMWLKAAGVEGVDADRGPQFGDGSFQMLVEAAIAGQGVALASRVLVADDLRAGRLVRPFAVDTPQAFCWWVVCPESVADAPMISAFREWLIDEARADSGEIEPAVERV